MRDQEDQMDVGSAGAMRGQGHVRIPKRVITRSLRTGVTPGMNQPIGRDGQFQQGGRAYGHGPVPIRQMPRYNKGNMFHQFMNRSKPDFFNRINGGNWANRIGHQQGASGHNGATDPHWQQFKMPGGRPPMEHPPIFGGGMGGRPPAAGGNHNPFEGGGNAWQGGQPPVGPLGPILGHGQTMNGMIQAMMDDLQGGVNPQQFANMQGGSLPGGMGGDFLRALGAGDMNNSPLQALVQHLTQGAAGADGTPGNYTINGDQGGAIAQILRQAIRNNPNFNPPPRPGRRMGMPFRPGTPGQVMGQMPMNGSGGLPAPMPL